MPNLFGILGKLLGAKDRIKAASDRRYFPPPLCLVCQSPWRYGSDEPGREWVECGGPGRHRLTKPDFDRRQPPPPMIGDGDTHGQI